MAEEYEKGLKGIPGLRLPIEKPWAKNVYWMYGLLVEKAFGLSRDQLMAQLKIQGIDTRSFFVPMHMQTVFKNKAVKSKQFGRYPVAEMLSEQGLYLPSGLTITRDQIRHISDQIKRMSIRSFKRK